jgi:beta-galactosidase/beta-glucuronidase
VWLEAVAPKGLKDCQITADLDNSRFVFLPRFYSVETGLKFRIKLKDEHKVVAQEEFVGVDNLPVFISLKSPKLWSPESPFLYDIVYQVLDANNKVIDEVFSYAGMRKIHIEGNKIFLNNQPLYLRLVLDQGFYPDGIWTAPTDAALKRDIQLSLDAGFNGARLHQKVFEERFHYWADKMGYLTWGESSSWGIDMTNIEAARNFIPEWEEIVARDRNHPSIIAWTPFNETSREKNNQLQHNRLILDVFNSTKQIDPTRPINDASGWFHVKTDLFTAHCYEQDPEAFKRLLVPGAKGKVYQSQPDNEVDYDNQPYFLDEYGGIKWIPKVKFSDNSWGYGNAPKTVEELYKRLEGLTDVILSVDYISGYCYTQLTDVEQEQNGIYNYDRTEKFDMSRIKQIFSKRASNSKK